LMPGLGSRDGPAAWLYCGVTVSHGAGPFPPVFQADRMGMEIINLGGILE
jgi:hypothetical protein